MTNIQQVMIDLQQQIYDSDYYKDLYENCLVWDGMTYEGISSGGYSDTAIINLCNDFWLALPDNATIRRQPFFALCDIAEKCFDEGEE